MWRKPDNNRKSGDSDLEPIMYILYNLLYMIIMTSIIKIEVMNGLDDNSSSSEEALTASEY
jgi:hypothetical protein